MKSRASILTLNDVSMVPKIVSKHNYHTIFVVNISVLSSLICVTGWVEGMLCRVSIVFYVPPSELTATWKMVESSSTENMFILTFMSKINCLLCLPLRDNFHSNRSWKLCAVLKNSAWLVQSMRTGISREYQTLTCCCFSFNNWLRNLKLKIFWYIKPTAKKRFPS